MNLVTVASLGSSYTDLHFDTAGCFFFVLTLASFDSCSGQKLGGSRASSEMVLLSSACSISSGPVASLEACKAAAANPDGSPPLDAIQVEGRRPQGIAGGFLEVLWPAWWKERRGEERRVVLLP